MVDADVEVEAASDDEYDGPVATQEEIELLSESTGQSTDLCLLVLLEVSAHFSGPARMEVAAEMLMKRSLKVALGTRMAETKEDEDPDLEAALKLSMEPLPSEDSDLPGSEKMGSHQEEPPAAASSSSSAPARPARPASNPPALASDDEEHQQYCRLLRECVEKVMSRTGLGEAECREALFRHGSIIAAAEVLNKRADLKENEDPDLQAALKLSMLAWDESPSVASPAKQDSDLQGSGNMGSHQEPPAAASSSRAPARPASLPVDEPAAKRQRIGEDDDTLPADEASG